MPDQAPRLYLVTPVLDDGAAFAPRLAEACGAGPVAAVLLNLSAADERTLVNRVKELAPAAQEHGAAVLVAAPGEADLAAVAARGGADGAHISDPGRVREWRERLKGERILGVGGLRSKDEAMAAGEAAADYLMFGEPRPDGSLPPLEAVVERAAWWAEIFETPCVVYAPSLDALPAITATGAEFVAVGEAIWGDPEGPGAAVRKALAALQPRERAS